MNWTIRLSDRGDLPGIVNAQNVCSPIHRLTLAEVERDADTLPSELQRIVYVALVRDKVVGYAIAQRLAGMYHPQKFMMELGVRPRYRRRGIGSALFEALSSNLKTLDVLSITVQVSEQDPVSMKIATDRGFVEQKRDFVSELRVAHFDKALIDESRNRMASYGINLCSFDEVDSPSFRREWFDLFCVVRQDVPRSYPPTPISFEFFEQQVIEDPDLARTATMFAFKDGRCIGFTGGYFDQKHKILDQWLTAVHRDSRSLGVAMALKTTQIMEAKRLGLKSIKTDNDSRNAPMLAVNAKLGFVRQPAVLSMRKEY